VVVAVRPPCEAIVRRYLPCLRAKVIKRLIEKYGWKLSEASRRLGVTLPAARKYRKLAHGAPHLPAEALDEAADRIAEMIASGASDADVLLAVCESCLAYRVSERYSELYRASFPGKELPAEFRSRWIDLVAERVRERVEVLREVSEALTAITGDSDFARLIPEVRMNIAMALKDAKGPDDVAAVPGRITVVRGRPYAAMPPEFGASRHLSRVLLEVMGAFKGVRAVICIKFDEKVAACIEELGLRVLYVTRESPSDKELLARVRAGLSGLSEPPDVIVDKGCMGIEPVAYVLGTSATEVVSKSKRILGRLKASAHQLRE